MNENKLIKRLPPQNSEAESAILGAILLENNCMGGATESLTPDSFYKIENKKIFSSMLSLYNKEQPIDLITLPEELKKSGDLEKIGGPAYIRELLNLLPTTAHFASYVSMVYDKNILRELISCATSIIENSYSQEADTRTILDESEHVIFSIAQNRTKKDFVQLKDVIHDTFDMIHELYENKEHITGVPTGYTEFDKMTSGLNKSDLVILAARPSMGKTAFALNVAENVAAAGHRVAIFSLEMSVQQLAMRLLSSVANVDAQKIRNGFIAADDWHPLTMAASKLMELPIFIDDSSSLTLMEIKNKARRLKSQHKIEVIIIDYLQLMHLGRKSESRQQEVSEMSRSLKSLARELDIPIVALSQLSRAVESRPNKRPMLSDLRESGSIEQDADIVIFLYRDEYYNDDSEMAGIAEVIIGKQRNGPVGTVKLQWDSDVARFGNLSYRDDFMNDDSFSGPDSNSFSND
ncbi:replicative DNA helicase [bacterium]|nr:replicative DNA helicase [bacterium]